MKKVLTSAFTLSLLAFTSHVVAQELWMVSLCEYTKADDKNRVRKLLSDNNMNVRRIYSAVKCNGDSLIQFAMRNNAYETGAFYVKQMPAKSLKEEGLEEWAAANGFGTSALVNDIKARVGQD